MYECVCEKKEREFCVNCASVCAILKGYLTYIFLSVFLKACFFTSIILAI